MTASTRLPTAAPAAASVTVLTFANTDERGAAFAHAGVDTAAAVRAAVERSWPTPADVSDAESHGRIIAHLEAGNGAAALTELTNYLAGWYVVREEVLPLAEPALRGAPAERQRTFERDFLVDVDLETTIDCGSLQAFNEEVEARLFDQGDLLAAQFLSHVSYRIVGRGGDEQSVRVKVSAVVVDSDCDEPVESDA